MKTERILADARRELAMVDEAIKIAIEENDIWEADEYEDLADFWVTIIKEFEAKAFRESSEHSYELYHTIHDKVGMDRLMKEFKGRYTYPAKPAPMVGPDAPMYVTIFTTELGIDECWKILFEQKQNFLLDGVREVKR